MSCFCGNINEYVSIGDSIKAIINDETRCLCKISIINNAHSIICIKNMLRRRILQPIRSNIYENYTTELDEIDTNTNNKLYNIKELVLLNYDVITISINNIFDTIIVATPDQLLNDNGILYGIFYSISARAT